MGEPRIINYRINEPVELNLSYMPFIQGGGLFIPSFEMFALGEVVQVELTLPGKKDPLSIPGKIIWITPHNALHHVLPGIGIQFIGSNSQEIRTQLEAHLDKSMEIGGYSYGMLEETKKEK